ncbi:DNA (cytosine-5)-methyltransferase DRM2-like [Phalaenopsis equestris]|uniref:DNA (cytosine-5)-methyltransferase DRM2-like n=1 Tax=Phalaenopsis equestris TaxID=78828 RepID=UPI0009E22EC3|nr:DNA (cytosine-5)-methyltransferase DRM2-like [Phalaenopsis equestris]
MGQLQVSHRGKAVRYENKAYSEELDEEVGDGEKHLHFDVTEMLLNTVVGFTSNHTMKVLDQSDLKLVDTRRFEIMMGNLQAIVVDTIVSTGGRGFHSLGFGKHCCDSENEVTTYDKRDEVSWVSFHAGPNSSVLELADSIHAAQMAEEPDGIEWDYPKPRFEAAEGSSYCSRKKRRLIEVKPKLRNSCLSKRRRDYVRKSTMDFDDASMSIPKPMVGFGLPNEKCIARRNLPDAAIGPPYFYYENVALAPKGVWETISRFLYDIEPEFVDSKYFCAAARKRAYIHNLPIEDRFPLLPIPAKTIQEALPMTRRWWPQWDKRVQLNCLQTCIASAKLTERIRKALENYGDNPPASVQEYVLAECRKWNLVWVGHHKAAPLEPDEVEMLLGFPNNHTRGGGISRTDRYKSLGNSFQVNTVAYHLSVLKKMFPNGINLLSLFSGIGGAEVALHRLQIPLKTVVSVEKSAINRNIVRSFWEQTNQKGNLIDLDDVQQLDGDRLESLMKQFGPFDLVIGGSPCNNLTGSNRYTRDGLEGEHSSLFYDYFRILDLVKSIMAKNL